jgi:hypothetical protein
MESTRCFSDERVRDTDVTSLSTQHLYSNNVTYSMFVRVMSYYISDFTRNKFNHQREK